MRSVINGMPRVLRSAMRASIKVWTTAPTKGELLNCAQANLEQANQLVLQTKKPLRYPMRKLSEAMGFHAVQEF
jgi:hypothetical protein